MNFSVIIPVYNRPDEVKELLDSFLVQKSADFEIIIIEDGSTIKCENVVKSYQSKFDISYFFKENGGPASARNHGMAKAKYDYFVFFDSDCIIPEAYFEIVSKALNDNFSDAYGGPDAAHKSFTSIQKAISYSMTSFFTTGGIRGGNEKMEQFKPRSFNMGYSRNIYEKTGGFSNMRFGEDVDMSLKILENGFKTQLIRDAFVYHKRRTDFRKFFKQVYNSGIARINLEKRHPGSLKLVHAMPAAFFLGTLFLIFLSVINWMFLLPIGLYIILILADALIKTKSFIVACTAIPASFTQLYGYGLGFIVSFWRRIFLKQDEFHAFRKNFYK
ncbi:MAG: glycosyltransferase [Bacteroidales bacterium]|nr:glycosyltransferase [Bacteroidales bacterium]